MDSMDAKDASASKAKSISCYKAAIGGVTAAIGGALAYRAWSNRTMDGASDRQNSSPSDGNSASGFETQSHRSNHTPSVRSVAVLDKDTSQTLVPSTSTSDDDIWDDSYALTEADDTTTGLPSPRRQDIEEFKHVWKRERAHSIVEALMKQSHGRIEQLVQARDGRILSPQLERACSPRLPVRDQKVNKCNEQFEIETVGGMSYSVL
jgi:hypothetical protein